MSRAIRATAECAIVLATLAACSRHDATSAEARPTSARWHELPAPSDPADARGREAPLEWVASGGELRAATPFVTGKSLEARFVAPARATLEFSVLVRSARARQLSDAVSVEVGTEGPNAQVTMVPVGSDADRWQSIAFPLALLDDRFEGGEVRVRVELRAPDAECAISPPRVFVADPTAPLVLLVTSDTHRADHLGAATGTPLVDTPLVDTPLVDTPLVDTPLVDTPALDALAARGLCFVKCFSTTNSTISSHSALLTGVHPRDSRVIDNGDALVEGASTLAEVFRDHGFATIAAVSAIHLDPRTCGLGQGFDRVYTSLGEQRPAGGAVNEIASALREHPDRPVFAWLHLFDPHTPYAPPPPFDKRYYPPDKNPFDKRLPRPSIDRRLLPRNMANLRDVDFLAAQYRGEVSFVDSALAGLLDDPRVRDGIVAFTGDHGESFGEHGVYWDHAELYPETIHVPLILAYPGCRARRVETRISSLDLGRTLLDLAGLERAAFPGRDLAAELDRTDAPVYTIAAYGFSASITSGRWHLILELKRHPIDSAKVQYKEAHEVELYDLEADPKTLHDVSDEEHARARELRADLVQWLEARSAAGLRAEGPRDPGALSRLAALGYVEAESPRAAEEPWFDAACRCAACKEFE